MSIYNVMFLSKDEMRGIVSVLQKTFFSSVFLIKSFQNCRRKETIGLSQKIKRVRSKYYI